MEPHFIKPKSDGGRMQAGLFAYVIRTGKHTILVDTCVGNDKPRAFSPAWNMKKTNWLSDLARHGGGARIRHAYHVHPFACRSCGLEHAAGKWPLGSHFSQCALYFSQNRI